MNNGVNIVTVIAGVFIGHLLYDLIKIYLAIRLGNKNNKSHRNDDDNDDEGGF